MNPSDAEIQSFHWETKESLYASVFPWRLFAAEALPTCQVWLAAA